MKIYFHLCLDEFSNSYLVVNDDPLVKEAIVIDPGKVSSQLVEQIESGGYKLSAVLITRNNEAVLGGLSTLMKIYSPQIYAADCEIESQRTVLIRGDGKLRIAGLDVDYFSIMGHSTDSMCFKIGNVLFTGDSLTAGVVGETSGTYFKRMLCSNIEKKIFSQNDELVVMPGHGPPTTVATERYYNIDITENKKYVNRG
ncbi:MAG: MBL fold metallo-hydrolase [Treponema sp.]|nr:MBL fold metallo-hydrolase [Treponema sp.]MBQ2080285.1 MBL fold metallo-hydrolase [Treponema sp.]